MTIKSAIKANLPHPLWNAMHRARTAAREASAPILERFRETTLARAERRAKAHFYKDYSDLAPRTVEIMRRIEAEALRINGDDWNYYSGTLHPAHAWVFERVVKECSSYLEIGSAKGISMSLIGSLLTDASLTSLDPYFEKGYTEGARGPYSNAYTVRISKSSREAAQELYRAMNLDVYLVELDSTTGLKQFVRDGRQFDLIYIDGFHEGMQPTIDLGLSLSVLSPGGIIMLDDWLWPDVLPLKRLCDENLQIVAQSAKVAAYRV